MFVRLTPTSFPTCHVLYCGLNCYLDDSNGAAVASRSLLETLARRGFTTEALTGSMFELGPGVDLDSRLSAVGAEPPDEGGALLVDVRGVQAPSRDAARLVLRGVAVTIHRGSARAGLFGLYEEALDRFRPDILINFGDDPFSCEVRSRAHARGIAVVFPLHNLGYRDPRAFVDVDAVIVPSRLAADYYGEALGLRCTVLPYLVDPDRILAPNPSPRYVTFVNPSFEKGVYAFARIADELGRSRPDIPLLVVESRGTERTLADCGLDLARHGNVHLMAHTADPRRFWGPTRILLMPSLWWENQPLAAIEAMTNGIPVVGSDRGGIPETLGESGMTIPLPPWMTPHTRTLPRAEEVGPWIEAIVRLWDDAELLEEHRSRALAESRRWDPDAVEPLYLEFFAKLLSGR